MTGARLRPSKTTVLGDLPALAGFVCTKGFPMTSFLDRAANGEFGKPHSKYNGPSLRAAFGPAARFAARAEYAAHFLETGIGKCPSLWLKEHPDTEVSVTLRDGSSIIRLPGGATHVRTGSRGDAIQYLRAAAKAALDGELKLPVKAGGAKAVTPKGLLPAAGVQP
jgi:hypothetical protein